MYGVSPDQFDKNEDYSAIDFNRNLGTRDIFAVIMHKLDGECFYNFRNYL